RTLTVQPIDPFKAVSPALSLQDHVHAAVAEVNSCGRSLATAQRQCRCTPRNRPLRVDCAREPKHRTCITLTRALTPDQIRHDLPPARGLQSIFDNTCCNIALSSDRSATRRLSFAFSSSSC